MWATPVLWVPRVCSVHCKRIRVSLMLFFPLAVLFIYDTFITFDREVGCFCTATRTGATVLFFANKWLSMAVYVMALVGYASQAFPSDKVSTIIIPHHGKSDQKQRFVYSLTEITLPRNDDC